MQHTTQQNISILPLDITLLISEYLDTADLRQCIRVSIAWNTIFRPVLYQTVKINTYSKFCSFYKTIEKSTKRIKQNGNIPRMAGLGCSVRTLHLEDGLMTVDRMQQLATLCPNVTSVSYDWTQADGALYRSPSTRLFGSPVTFFEHFHPSTLRSLSLESRHHNRHRHTFSPQVLFSIFRHMPQLEAITLNNRMGNVTIAFMEQLHDTCSRLKQLTIPGNNIKNINDETVPIDTIKAVAPARTMESLSMYKIFLTVHGAPISANANVFTGPWFTYISHKYPALRQLALPPLPGYNSTPRRTQDYNSQATPTIALRDFFPQLDELILPDFADRPSAAWPQLVKGIRKIQLCGDVAPYFSDWISNEATKNLQRLSMPCFPDDLNDLRHCPQLQELELDGRTFESKTTMMLDSTCSVNIDVILSCCPTLKRLKVSKGNIRHHGDYTSRITKTSLRALILHDAVIESNYLLEHVGQRCPELVHLDLRNCMWIIPRKCPVIQIDLSQQRLSYFRMTDSSVYSENPATYYGDQEPIAWNIFLMLKTSEWNESSSQVFSAGVDLENMLAPFVRQVHNPAIIRWLDAGLDDDLEDNAKIPKGAMRAIASFKDTISCVHELTANVGHDSRKYGRAGAVLWCHSISRLYFGQLRCDLESNTLSKKK